MGIVKGAACVSTVGVVLSGAAVCAQALLKTKAETRMVNAILMDVADAKDAVRMIVKLPED